MKDEVSGLTSKRPWFWTRSFSKSCLSKSKSSNALLTEILSPISLTLLSPKFLIGRPRFGTEKFLIGLPRFGTLKSLIGRPRFGTLKSLIGRPRFGTDLSVSSGPSLYSKSSPETNINFGKDL